jgi:hypothetical protein
MTLHIRNKQCSKGMAETAQMCGDSQRKAVGGCLNCRENAWTNDWLGGVGVWGGSCYMNDERAKWLKVESRNE